MSSLLLATKLHIPPPRPDLVRRPRLTERLDEGLRLGHRLMLISASAGYGKTTLVTEWLHSMDRPFAWLTLEDDDNDPARFLSYLVAALRSVDPGVGHSVQPLLEAFEPGRANSILTALINDVAEARHSFVVALDDYHVIHTLPIHQQLAFLVDHLPQQMHLVIATREDPPLPLSRLRARRQMTEIRQADLRFTSEEAAMLLNQIMGLKLTPTDITALESRTEGWIAGLQLAALSMCQRSDPHAFLQSFTGSTRYVLDYLMDEVFRRQPEEVQDFLVQTSVLDRLSTPLCDAVTGREDSQRMLLTLEQANLFIVPLDEGRQWYRYHRLFADLLRHRLGTRRSVDDAATLHGRASQWHEANGFPAEAVRHALAAADWERAATLICDLSSAMFKRGELVTLLKWMRALPDEHVRARPDLCINYSWALILTGQLEAAESYLGEAERVAQDEHALLGDIISAQAYIARAQGDDRRTIELSQRALSLLPSDALNERSVVAVNLGIAHWTSGNLTQSESALTVAEDAAEQSGNVYARWTAHSFRAVLQAAWGRLRQAAELLRQAIRSGEQSPAIALAYNELSALLYEWNDLEAAVDHLQQGIELGKRSGNVEVQIGGYRTLARVKQAQGDSSVALSALQKAHQLARDSDVPPLMRARNAACHFQIALAQDDMAIATHWAEQVTEDADASPFYPRLGLTPARLLLAQGQAGAAAGHLKACHAVASRAGWQYGVIETRVLQALAAPGSGNGLAFLADALELAEPEGYVRTFIDKGEPIAALLQEASAQGIAREYVSHLLTAFAASKCAVAEAGRLQVPVQPLPEELSDRELEVLSLLADGLTNQEIAQALFLSLNTVKTHLRSIYGKLAVHNRREAAAQARELHLLS